MQNGFVFYRSFITGTEELNDADFRILIRAIAAYALDGEEPELSGVLKMLFEFARPNIDFSNKKRKDGAKGGRPRNYAKTTGLSTGLSEEEKEEEEEEEKEEEVDVERECEGETPTPPATPRRRRTTKGGFSTSQGYDYDQILEENRRRLEERVGGVIDIKTAKEAGE